MVLHPEEYLKHAGFVQSLARRLVMDENVAADLSQAAWVSFLEHPPSDEKPIRAWFNRVVRNFAVTFHRRESRLKMREQAVAHSESLPSTEKIVEKLEIRRLLIDAVLELSEPYRSTLSLRYYEGLTAREIAERLNIPLETVRAREKRGLDKLRRRLDRLHNGDRKRWCMGLAPLAGLTPAIHAASASVAVPLAGALTMTAKFKTAIVAAFLLFSVGAAVLLWPEERSKESFDDGPLSSAAAVADSPHQVHEALAHFDEERESMNPDHEGEAVPASFRRSLGGFTGRVVDIDGNPVPHETVELFSVRPDALFQGMGGLDDGARNPVRLKTQSTQSGEDGTFRFMRILPRAFHTIVVDRKGDRPAFRVVDTQPNPGDTVELGDIVLHAMGVLTGRVLSDTNAPLPGVRVRAVQAPALLFSLGVQDIRDGSSLFLADDPVFGRKTVFDLPDVYFEILRILPIPECVTDEDGNFCLQGAAHGSVCVVADCPGRSSRWKTVWISEEETATDAGTLHLGTGLAFEGKVVDGGNEPVADVEVRVGTMVMSREWCLLHPPQFSDRDGRIALSGLGSGPVLCALRRFPNDPWTFVGPFNAQGGVNVLTLPSASDLKIRVIDPGHAPVTNARFRIRQRSLQNLLPDNPPRDPGARLQRGTGEGDYVIHDLAPGRYELVVFAEGYGPDVSVVTMGKETIEEEITLQPGLDVRVRVLEPDQETPLPWADVFLRPIMGGDSDSVTFNNRSFSNLEELVYISGTVVMTPTEADWFADNMKYVRSRTNENGWAYFTDLNPGRYAVTVTHPGYAATRETLELPEGNDIRCVGEKGKDHELVMSVVPGGALAGTVLHHGSSHEPPFAVYALNDDERHHPEAWLPRFSLTDNEGHFKIRNLSPGSCSLFVVPRLFGVTPFHLFSVFMNSPLGQAKASVVSGETVEIDIPLSGAQATIQATVNGTVSLNGKACEGAWVRLHADGEEASATTDVRGWYSIEGIDMDEAFINVTIPKSKEGAPSFTVSDTVMLEGSGTYKLDFPIRTGRLFGRVLSNTTGEPVAQVEVRAWNTDKRTDTSEIEPPFSVMMTTFSGPDGRFLFDRLPAGKYFLRAKPKEGGASWSRPESKIESVEVFISASAGPVDLALMERVDLKGRVELPDREEAETRFLLSLTPDEMEPVESTTIHILGDGSSIIMGRKIAFVKQETGAFVVRNILPGEYQTTLHPAEGVFTNGDSPYETMYIEVPVQGLENLVLKPEKRRSESDR